MNKSVVRFYILAATIGTAIPVQAEPPILVEGLPTAVVSFGDLDLSNAAGQATLYGRVRHAANRLCTTDVRGIGPVMEERRCVGVALGQAQAQIDRAISRYASGRGGEGASLTMAAR